MRLPLSLPLSRSPLPLRVLFIADLFFCRVVCTCARGVPFAVMSLARTDPCGGGTGQARLLPHPRHLSVHSGRRVQADPGSVGLFPLPVPTVHADQECE
jgi:hypothetical protein